MATAIIFDFDGTIADTIPAICEGVNLTMEAFGFPLHTEAEVRTYINNGPRKLITRALPKERQEDEALIDRVLAYYNQAYQTVCMHTDHPYDGIAELIAHLRAEDYRIGVLSNKQDFLVRPMCDAVLHGGVDAVLGSLPDHPAKPHPFLSEAIAKMLGVTTADCILIGDSDVDVHTAKNAGMQHIGVTWGYRDANFLRENGATNLVNTTAELYTQIKQLTKGKDI